MISKKFHTFIRWALGLHGAIHIVETVLNIYERAYMSALTSLLTGLLMLAGSYIDSSHHKKEREDNYD
tara:strand:+ start:259 stop:462 length:204 start_codon:yes stop_codon:yes gene_type:complete